MVGRVRTALVAAGRAEDHPHVTDRDRSACLAPATVLCGTRQNAERLNDGVRVAEYPNEAGSMFADKLVVGQMFLVVPDGLVQPPRQLIQGVVSWLFRVKSERYRVSVDRVRAGNGLEQARVLPVGLIRLVLLGNGTHLFFCPVRT